MIARTSLGPEYTIPRIINGGWQLSAGHTKRNLDVDTVIDAMIQMAEAGFTAFDCADIYTGVEELFGRFLTRWRQRSATPIQIHTKYVPNLEDLPNLTREQITAVIDRSLKRLGLERLDLVQFHWWDYKVPGFIEAALHLQRLQKEGKIRLIGGTNFDVPHLQELVAAGIDISSMQVQYSLLDRRPEHGMAAYCQEQNIQLLCYGSLAGGFLSERYLGSDPPEKAENRSLTKYELIIEEFGGWPLFQELLTEMTNIAVASGVTAANVAVAWTLSRPGVGAAIVGARHGGHIASNRTATTFRLKPTQLARLNAILAHSKGPAGDTFGLERIEGGPHMAIMKTNLN